MENPVILLRPLNALCAREMEVAVSLSQARDHTEIPPVLSQQLLIHMAAKQKPHVLTPCRNGKERTVLEFDATNTTGEA